jgi:hypothetical protein
MLINISITSERHIQLGLNYVESNEVDLEGDRRMMFTGLCRVRGGQEGKMMWVIKVNSTVTTVKNSSLSISKH